MPYDTRKRIVSVIALNQLSVISVAVGIPITIGMNPCFQNEMHKKKPLRIEAAFS
jgi:hypothetical protein